MGTDGFAWQRLASTLLKGIEQGVYPIGSRMPSVRDLMYQQGVSRNTILKAYYELESLGKIETRERSGFFVRRAEHRPSSPIATRPEPKNLNEGITEFFRKPDMLDLGSASLHLSLIPQKTLADLFREAMLQPSLLSYAPVAGLTELRTVLAAHMVEGGTPINPEEILVTSGCMEAMNLALDALCSPNDTVAVESPAYYGFFQALSRRSLRVMEIPSHPLFGMDPDELEEHIRHHPIKVLLAVPNFSNPSGAVLSRDRKLRLLELASRYGFRIIESDVYAELSFQKERPPSLLSLDRENVVIHCSSVSKTLSPGLRIGWCVARDLITEISHRKFVNTVSSPTPNQWVVARFFSSGKMARHLKKVSRALKSALDEILLDLPSRLPGNSRMTMPSGGVFLWVEVPDLDAETLFWRLSERGVFILPGTVFSTSGRHANCFRLNISAHCDKDWNRGMRILQEEIGKLVPSVP